MIIEIGYSIELCDYLTTHSLKASESESAKKKTREINKNIARYLSSWLVFASHFSRLSFAVLFACSQIRLSFKRFWLCLFLPLGFILYFGVIVRAYISNNFIIMFCASRFLFSGFSFFSVADSLSRACCFMMLLPTRSGLVTEESSNSSSNVCMCQFVQGLNAFNTFCYPFIVTIVLCWLLLR